jgi:hypothetical protein
LDIYSNGTLTAKELAQAKGRDGVETNHSAGDALGYMLINGLAGVHGIQQAIARRVADFCSLMLQDPGLFASAPEKRTVSAGDAPRIYQRGTRRDYRRSNQKSHSRVAHDPVGAICVPSSIAETYFNFSAGIGIQPACYRNAKLTALSEDRRDGLSNLLKETNPI